MKTDQQTNSIRFTLFADLHYKKSMYIPSVADLQSILDRANQSGSEFALHAGDFCNDYQHSPELISAYLNNAYNLPVYGVYGNHELETPENSMANVTPCLCNREVVWGTPDGKIGDGSIAYYYFDQGIFRFVCLDTNYSKNPATEEWEHNASVSHGPPKGNVSGNALGPDQLFWLEKVLTAATKEQRKCIVIGHCGFSGLWWSNPEAAAVREIYQKANGIRKETVLLSINGHLHTNHIGEADGVVYFDVNTVRNNLWVVNDKAFDHYGDKTYFFTDYDAEGKETAGYDRPINEMRMAKNTWFNSSPLSAIVTVWENGKIEIEGSESAWLYGIAPDPELYHHSVSVAPYIPSASFAACDERSGK